MKNIELNNEVYKINSLVVKNDKGKKVKLIGFNYIRKTNSLKKLNNIKNIYIKATNSLKEKLNVNISTENNNSINKNIKQIVLKQEDMNTIYNILLNNFVNLEENENFKILLFSNQNENDITLRIKNNNNILDLNISNNKLEINEKTEQEVKEEYKKELDKIKELLNKELGINNVYTYNF